MTDEPKPILRLPENSKPATPPPPPPPTPAPKPTGRRTVEVKAFKITLTVKVGDLPFEPEPPPNKSSPAVDLTLQCKGTALKVSLNGKSYRKAIKNDPTDTALIQGKLEGGKIVEAGIAVAPKKPVAPPADPSADGVSIPADAGGNA